MLQSFGENEDLTFNQNTVPFDFDGYRLLWLEYKDNDIRELSIYNLDPLSDKQPMERVNRFVKADGMISHARLLRMVDSSHRNDQHLFWVKNGTQIIRFNLETKSCELVGETPDSILAFSVSTGYVRQADRPLSDQKVEDLEADDVALKTFYISTLDESENICIFTNKD